MKIFRLLYPLLPACIAALIIWARNSINLNDGIILFALGMLTANGVALTNKESVPAAHPLFAWDEMHAGDRLAFYMPAIAYISLVTVIVLVVTGISFSLPGWLLFLLALACLAAGSPCAAIYQVQNFQLIAQLLETWNITPPPAPQPRQDPR